MSRVYGEPVDVWVRNGRPARFVWRDRLYTVFGVMDHWVVSTEWWGQARDAGGPGNHEFWRVEASPGQNAQPATYELRLDVAAGNWLLARVWD